MKTLLFHLFIDIPDDSPLIGATIEDLAKSVTDDIEGTMGPQGGDAVAVVRINFVGTQSDDPDLLNQVVIPRETSPAVVDPLERREPTPALVGLMRHTGEGGGGMATPRRQITVLEGEIVKNKEGNA